MADPLSVTVSVIALIGAAHKISSSISYLRKIVHVPARVYVLKNEVTDLEVVLKQAASAIQQNNVDGQDEAFKATLGDAKKKLAEVSSTIERIGNALERNKSKFIKRNAISAKEMAILETLLTDIRALKESFGLMLGFSTSADVQRIKLELHNISYLTKESGQVQMGRHEAVSKEIQDTYSAVTTRLDRNYYEFDQRMKGIERLLLLEGQAARISSYTEEVSASHETGAATSSIIEAVKVTVSVPNACSAWCPCSCHAKQKLEIAGHSIVDKVVGKMFLGYSGLPYISKRCDIGDCAHGQKTRLNVEYWFPWWFMAMNLKVSMQYARNIGPEMQLTTTRRIPDTAQAITYVMTRDIEGLKSLFRSGLASVRDVSDSRGFSLMRWALYGEWRWDVVQFLISQGARVDDISYDNVWDFIFRGQVPEKAQHELRCITADKARDWVEEQNFPLVHQIVLGLSNKSLETELTENVLAKYLKDAAGRTALDWAVARDQVDSVTILLEHGANPNTLDISGRTAMLHAVDCNSARCMRLLLKAGAHPDPVLPKGLYRSSPLTAAAMGGKKELMQILLEFEANANCTNPEGLTPLHSIARSRDAACALILLEHGADLNALSNDGRTPLTTAIIYNNHEVLELFLARCYEYIATARLRGPRLLPVIAEFADHKTMTILASSSTLKLNYDLTQYSRTANLAILQKRRDYSEKLAAAFEDVITIAEADDLTSPVDSLIESGLYFSARSSFRSEISDANEILCASDEFFDETHSLPNSPMLSRSADSTPTSPILPGGFQSARNSPKFPRGNFSNPNSPVLSKDIQSQDFATSSN